MRHSSHGNKTYGTCWLFQLLDRCKSLLLLFHPHEMSGTFITATHPLPPAPEGAANRRITVATHLQPSVIAVLKKVRPSGHPQLLWQWGGGGGGSLF